MIAIYNYSCYHDISKRSLSVSLWSSRGLFCVLGQLITLKASLLTHAANVGDVMTFAASHARNNRCLRHFRYRGDCRER